MTLTQILLFVVLPYISLTMFVFGHIYRYRTDAFGWNVQSSEFLAKENTRAGITLFHWGILFTLFGHAGGLLIPQRVYDAFGISASAHTALAVYAGMLIGILALVGIVLLLYRRAFHPRVKAVTTWDKYTVLALLFISIGTGMYNVFFGHYNVLYSVAPWIRGIVTFRPDPTLMEPVPVSYKIHIVSAFVLFAFSPFTRLVHIWSVPLGYLLRRPIVYRRYPSQLDEKGGK